MAELTLILNFIIIFLLVTAIMYGFVLNRRIRLIRESGRELSHLFRSFDDTILKAQESIEDLKRVSREISDGLQKKIDRAALMIDDLEFLGEKTLEISNKASAVLTNLKKVENILPEIERKMHVSPMPLVTVPKGPTKNYIPEKPIGKQNKQKALENLLEEVSAIRQSNQTKNVGNNPTGVNNNIKNASKAPLNRENNMPEGNDEEKRQFSIASALKAMGYGE